jgi:hypothetical protein
MAAPSRLDTLQLDAPRAGALGPGDSTLTSGEYSDHWGFIGKPGEVITVDLTSESFDPYLILTRPDGTQVEDDDGGTDTNARISQRLRLDGRYGLIVTSYAPGEMGPYTIWISEGLPPAPDSIAHEAPRIPLSPGDSISGALAGDDTRLHGGHLLDVYTFDGKAGHTLVFDMKSTTIDSHLTLLHPDGEESVNDDAEPGVLNSHLEVTLPVDGAYLLRASSFQQGEVGPYQLNVHDSTRYLPLGDSAGSSVRDQMASEREMVTYLIEDLPESLGVLHVRLEGDDTGGDVDLEVLAPRQTRRSPGSGAWSVIGASRRLGSTEEITVGTQGARPYLVRVRRAENDPAPFALSAWVERAPEALAVGQRIGGTLSPARGGWLAQATAPWDGHLLARVEAKGGRTQMRIATQSRDPQLVFGGDLGVIPVRQGEAVTLLVSPDALESKEGDSLEFRLTTDLLRVAQQISAVAPLRGALPPSDSPAAVHPLWLPQGGLARVTLAQDPGTATPLSMTLTREDDGAMLGRVDAAPGQRGSVLVSLPAETGTLVVVTSGKGTTEALPYSLQLEAGPQMATTPLALGTPATGVASADSGAAPIWRFQSTKPALRRIVLTTSGPTGSVAAEIIGTDGTRKRLEATSNHPGDALLLTKPGVTHYARILTPTRAATAPMPYTLEMFAIDAPPLADADDSDEPELWAILCGISNYAGTLDDLPFCKADAVRLQSLLTSQGYLRPDHCLLLTDAEATRAALEASFQEMAARVGPNDTFLFFFSGHGGQTDPRVDPEELDGRDEFLCTHDSDAPGGNIEDDDFAAWVDAIDSRLTIITIDACNAGGFAKELGDEPGRLCVFATEEDLLSYTFAEYKAGGIMAHALARGLEGEADVDADGVITAGEITDFLQTEMAGVHISDFDHASRRTQVPVSSRTVPYDEPLITLAE